MPKTYFNSEVLEYLGDKISNSPTPIPYKGYDAASRRLTPSSIEFPTFVTKE